MSVADDTILNDLLQLFFGNTKRGLHFIESVYEVVPVYTKVLDIIRDAGNCPNLGDVGSGSNRCQGMTHLDVSVERKTRSTLYQTTDLGAREVLGESGQFFQVNVGIHDPVVPHLGCVDCQDLVTTMLIWKGDLHVHFQTTRTQQRLIDHVEAIGHANN